MLSDVYPHDVLGGFHLVRQRIYYNPVQMPRWKPELYKKINAQLYGLVPAFLKEISHLDPVTQTKV